MVELGPREFVFDNTERDYRAMAGWAVDHLRGFREVYKQTKRVLLPRSITLWLGVACVIVGTVSNYAGFEPELVTEILAVFGPVAIIAAPRLIRDDVIDHIVTQRWTARPGRKRIELDSEGYRLVLEDGTAHRSQRIEVHRHRDLVVIDIGDRLVPCHRREARRCGLSALEDTVQDGRAPVA